MASSCSPDAAAAAASAAAGTAAPVRGSVQTSSLSARELVSHVDEHNKELKGIVRAEMRANNPRHRATFIFIFNSAGDLYIQKRTMIKDYCPGYWDTTVGGCVQFQEPYEWNAKRELLEEVGVRWQDLQPPMQHWDTFYYEDEVSKCWGDMYSCTWDGPMTLQPEEVDEVKTMRVDAILEAAARGETFCPDGIAALRQLLAWQKEGRASNPVSDQEPGAQQQQQQQ